MEVEAQAEQCQISLIQDEEVTEEEASPNVVYAVYSELVMTTQNLTQALMVSNKIRVDAQRQKPVPVKRYGSPHRPKTMVEAFPRKRWNEASMYKTQHVNI